MREESQKTLTRSEQLIARANAVSIFDVLEDFFSIYVPREGNSYKSRCPFGDEHADGGLDKGFRTYPTTNSSMCFPMHGYMPPTRLIQNRFHVRATEAAETILRRYGLLRPTRYQDRMSELLEAHAGQEEQVGNPQHAVAALHLSLESDPNYRLRQFDADVMYAMEVVLNGLDEVVSEGKAEALREWYMKARSLMTQVVERKSREAR